MSIFRQEGPIKIEKEVKDEKEILPDGTVHHVHRERSSSFKNVQKCVETDDGDFTVLEETKEFVAGSWKEDVMETFEEPARCVREEKDYDEVQDDGTKIHKHVVVNRLEHHIRMHHEHFDSDHGRQAEDFDIDEVIPGTESTFVIFECEVDEDLETDVGGAGAMSGIRGNKSGKAPVEGK